MKKILLFATIGMLCLVSNAFAQPNIFNPNDPLVTYDPQHPPVTPPPNTLAKWVRTVRMDWNTDRFKSYYFNDLAFRLRFPNNYDPTNPTKKYPLILFFHGGGEVDTITDNEHQLFNGAQLFEQKINAGEFDGFMLFPLVKQAEAWNYSYYLKVNDILDSLQKYVHMDPDRVIAMGLSNGGFASLSYSADFPQRSATVISSSPALIPLVTDRQPALIHVPLWIASGGTDPNPDSASVQGFVSSFKAKGGDVRYNLYPELGHGTWDRQWAEPYLVPYWNAAHKANPLIFFQRNRFATVSDINAKLGITAGFAEYQWQKDGVTIPGASSNEYSPTQFGTYRVRFRRYDSQTFSEWSPIPATIIQDNTAPNAPTNLKAVYSNKYFVHLDWDNSTGPDVSGYDIYVNNVKKYSTTESSVTADGLAAGTTYSFTIKSHDIAGNLSAASNAVSASTTAVSNGLNYRYYEAKWDVLPNFNALTPVKTGSSSNINIGVRNAGVNDFFGFVWEGYINIPTAGTYTFETASDDGSKIYFGSEYVPTGNALVKNDGLHGSTPSVSATVNVPTAGLYPISITFFENNGGEEMRVFWSGPGFSRQPIPDVAFTDPNADNTPPSVPVNLKALYTGKTFVNLDWDNSTDNIAVAGYDIYVNGTKKYTTSESAFTADGLNPNTTYSFTVTAFDLLPNTSNQSTAVSATTASTNGLNYRYYEGKLDSLPNFNTLTPVKTGLTSNINIGVRNAGVNDFFSFVWEGYINIPVAGDYTFETASDDGSKVYFGSFYSPKANALVKNDYLHGSNPSVSATINIPVAGLYPFTVTYFENNGGEDMRLFWSGPGFGRQLIPDIAFTDISADNVAPSAPTNLKALYTGKTYVNLDWDNSTDNVSVAGYDVYVNGAKKYTTNESAVTADKLASGTSYNFTVYARDVAGNSSLVSNSISASTTTLANGLNYRYYEGRWDTLPNFNALTPVKTGAVDNINLGVRTAGVNDFFGFVWEGYINIQTPGTYTFETASDDGSKIYFGSFYSPTATALVNNNGLHGSSPSVSATVLIENAGLYPIAITYFENNGGEEMRAFISGPGVPRQLIPDMAFRENALNPAVVQQTAGTTSSFLTQERDEQPTGLKNLQAYPNPISNWINIAFYNNSQSSDIRANVYDMNGRLVYNQYFRNIPTGNNTLRMNVNGNKLAPGSYFVRLDVNGVPSKVIKLVKPVKE